MMPAGLRDSEAGVTERYCPDVVRKAWELCQGLGLVGLGNYFYSS